jgi:hypothetical protein
MSWWFGITLPDMPFTMDYDQMGQCSRQLDLIAFRCVRLSIDDGLTLDSVTTLMRTVPLGELKSLVVGRISGTGDFGNIPRETRPRLNVDQVQDLRVYLPSMALDLLPQTMNITSMRVTISPSSDPRMLIELSARSLTDLFIEYPEPLQTEQPVFSPGRPIIMRELVTFTLEVPSDFHLDRWLRHLFFPCVKILTIGFRDRRSARFLLPGSSDLAPVLDLDGINHFPNLRAITLCAQPMPNGFMTFTCSQPRLRNLAFVELGPQAVRSVTAALSIGQVLPRLRYVHFRNCHISEDDVELMKLVATQRALRPIATPFQIKCTSSASRQG